MASHEHLIRSEEPAPGSTLTQYTSWCGEKQLSLMFMTRLPTHKRLCPGCSAKYYDHQLKQAPNGFNLGERLDLSQDERRWQYKSVYPILDGNGVLFGHMTIENGWGRHWKVAALTVSGADPDIENPTMTVVLGQTLEHRSWLSKQALLFDVPKLVEEGDLKSATATMTEAKAYHTRLRQMMLDRELRDRSIDAERTATMNRITAGFAELLATKALTNLQRTAILDAAGLLAVKLPVRKLLKKLPNIIEVV